MATEIYGTVAFSNSVTDSINKMGSNSEEVSKKLDLLIEEMKNITNAINNLPNHAEIITK